MTTVMVLGLGVEGSAAVEHFTGDTDTKIVAVDKRLNDADFPWTDSDRVSVVTEGEAARSISTVDLFLRSPGIPPSHPLPKLAANAGVYVTTPTGYWLSKYAPPNTVTVTGTKGKSTTVGLITQLMLALGEDTTAFGNIGSPPLGKHLPTTSVPIVELSSYMMHDLPTSKHLHVVTNLFREHTNWHGSESAYRDAKLKPFLQDNPVQGFAPRDLINACGLPSSVTPFESIAPLDDGTIRISGEIIKPADYNQEFSSFGSQHALRAAVCTAAARHDASRILKCLPEVLRGYTGLPHRQQVIPSSDQRVWVSDALATVPEATLNALDRWNDKPITVILGGADRGQNFSRLASYLASRPMITPIIFGSARESIFCALLSRNVSCFAMESLEAAIEKAASVTPKEGVVLFSPAAPSEAPHADYKERGQIFAAYGAQA